MLSQKSPNQVSPVEFHGFLGLNLSYNKPLTSLNLYLEVSFVHIQNTGILFGLKPGFSLLVVLDK